jgi:hypothetical protein
MSDTESGSKQVRRSTGVVVGGLAAGALISATIAAQPAEAARPAEPHSAPVGAAQAGTAPADAAQGTAGTGVPSVIPAPPSIQQQFRDAFAPGAMAPGAPMPRIVVSEG